MWPLEIETWQNYDEVIRVVLMKKTMPCEDKDTEITCKNRAEIKE